MAQPVVVSRDFDLGFVSDIPRSQLPRGAAYRMRDYIPRAEAPVRMRGGYEWATTALSDLSAASSVASLGWAPFPGDPHLIVVGDNGKIYRFTQFDGLGGGTFIGTATASELPPFWHLDRSIILPQPGADVTPYDYTVGAPYSVQPLGGTPPNASKGASWLSGTTLILANGYAKLAVQGSVGAYYPYRMWFSDPLNPEGWATANAFFDFPEEIVGVVPLSSFVMVWGYTGVHLLTGDIPPPGGNLALREYVFSQGTFDGQSLARYRDYIVWANNTGVWRSDGSTLTDLTEQGGISRYYRSLVEGFTHEDGWDAAGGVFRGYYLLSITNGDGDHVTTLVCDLDNMVWTEFKNLKASSYAERLAGPGTSSAAGSEELFFGHRETDRAGKISTLFFPEMESSEDADGTIIEPELETPFYKLDTPGEKRFRRAYVTTEMHPLGVNTFFDVYATFDGPDDYELIEQMTHPEPHGLRRRPVDIRRKALGVGLKIVQNGPSENTSIHEIELEGHPLEGSR